MPLTPGTYYVSIYITERRDEEAARVLAEENAVQYCGSRDMSSEILDSQIMPSEDGARVSLDLIFRCGAVGSDSGQ